MSNAQITGWYITRLSASNCLNLPVSSLGCVSFLELFLRENWIPKFPKNENIVSIFSKKYSMYELYNIILKLYKEGKIRVDVTGKEDKLYLGIAMKKAIMDGTVTELFGIDLSENILRQSLLNKKLRLTDSMKEEIEGYLLNCDYERIELTPYSSTYLTGQNEGLWELWDVGKESNLEIVVNEPLYARNPIKDIHNNGIVGIDFGTKSTIVMYMKGNAYINPMRVGSGKYTKISSAKDYENPTVMEFRNLEGFIKDYASSSGRPQTKWENLTISHKAFEQFNSIDVDSSNFYSYFSELKQWCGDKDRKIMISDNQGFWQNDNQMILDEIKKGSITIALYDTNGKKQENIQLVVNEEKMHRILKERIEKGILQLHKILEDIGIFLIYSNILCCKIMKNLG